MPWAEDTKVKICLVLGVSLAAPAFVQYVQEAMDSVANYGGETAITEIESYLTQLRAQQVSLNAQSKNAALIEADVLKWEPGQRNAGYKQEITRLKKQIAAALGLCDLLKGDGNRVKISRG